MGEQRVHRPVVWVSEGGRVFHLTKDCEALGRGRDNVVERGGTVGSLVRMAMSAAERSGRRLCRACRRAAR